jgi:PadR family transcriptional regulator PadR
MQEPTFHTLAALLDGPLHGYAIIRRVHDLTGGRVRLAAGTLYAALDRLTAAGLIEVERTEIVDGRARRTYRLTGAGREALRTEATRMQTLARTTLGRLAVEP